MGAVIRADHIEENIGTSFHTVRSEGVGLWLEASVFTTLMHVSGE